MSTPKTAAPTPQAVTNYVVLCLGALGGVLLAELDRLNVGTLLALLLGVGGVLSRTRLTPVLFLAVLLMAQVFHQLAQGHGRLLGGNRPWESLQPTDALLCVAGLAFVLGHYRLQGLTRHLLPTDPREVQGEPRWDWWSLGRSRRLVMHRRSAGLVTGGEFLWVAVAVLLAAGVGLTAWLALVQPRRVLDLPPYLGRLVLVAWVLATGGYVAAGLLGYWRRCLLSREQGLLVMQDTLWRATRREQRQGNLDVARQRRRAGQREGEA
jgi:hypothetical protein